MAKDLVFGDGRYQRWRLPDEYDLEALKSDLEEAFTKGTYIWIAVELGSDPPHLGDLILNGRVVPFAAIVEASDHVDRGGSTHTSLHAQPGDEIVVDGTEVGQPRRHGTVLEVRGEPNREHFRLRWEDDHESVFFPSSTAHTVHRADKTR